MTMASGHILFGTELRRRRSDKGLSLARLAQLVHYSKSHLSKVETGVKPPSADLARQCDAALGCEGELARLAQPGGRAGRPRSVDVADRSTQDRNEVWVLSLSADGGDRFGALSRRDLLAGGIAGLAIWSGLPLTTSTPAAETATATFRVMFDQLRHLGQHLDAATLLPVLITQTHALRRVAAGAVAAEQPAALRLAARFAEYTGWLAQESGDNDRALWWTDRAVEMAAAGGDRDMAAYASVRRALVTLYDHDAAQTVELARHARSATRHPRIGVLAAQREAQGHALAGEARACCDALDRAAGLLAQPSTADGPILGTSHVADPVTIAEGWCLVDLGQPARAAEILHRELAQIPDHARRARARYGARLALAHASSGEIEQACTVVEPVLETFAQIGSATIRADLRDLAHTLNRWHSHRTIQDTRLRLTGALSGAPRRRH